MEIKLKRSRHYRTQSGLIAYVHEEIGKGVFRGTVYKEGSPQKHQFTSWNADGTSVLANGRLDIIEEVAEDRAPEVTLKQSSAEGMGWGVNPSYG